MSLPRYGEYKDSGASWLGSVPAHWAVVQSRRYFANRNEKALAGDKQLTASQKHGVVYQADFMELEGQKVMQVIVGADILKHAEPNDFVISMRSFQGGIEWCGLRGSISSAYVMLVPNGAIWSPFYRYLFKSAPYIQALQATTNLVRDGQALRFSNFAQVPLPLFPVEEQQKIAAFLDRETAKIDALIAEQEKLIALLAEKRQATISHAVTKGLDPNAPMKDSGVAWLGKVPAHWDVVPLKYLVELRSGGTPSKDNLDYWDGDVPWASAKDLKVERLGSTTDCITQKAVDDGAASLVRSAAVLVVVRGMILARTFPVVETLVPMAINQDLKAVLPLHRLNASYLAWLLRGSAEESLQRLDEAGHGTKALRMDAWTSMQLPIPPHGEQIEIAEFLSRETVRLDALCAEAERAIDLLKERRSALIAAAVTGQIDVRQA